MNTKALLAIGAVGVLFYYLYGKKKEAIPPLEEVPLEELREEELPPAPPEEVSPPAPPPTPTPAPAPPPAPAPTLAPAPAPAVCRAPYPTLRSGSRGACVKLAQELLKKHGVDPGPIDGVFGTKTLAAVKSFQKARKLVVDGIIGPKTWAALTAPPPLIVKPAPKPPAGMLPVRATLEARGYRVGYDTGTGQAVITNPTTGKAVRFKGTTVGGTMYATQSQINSLIVQLGPITVAPTPAPKLPAGMLPVRATLEAKGYKIVWDAKNKRAVITNPRTKKTINFRGTMAKDTMYATRTQIDMIVRMLGKAAA